MFKDFESAFRYILKSIVQEVLDEFLNKSGFQQQQQSTANQPQKRMDERLLLSARETAKRLAVSERHLFNLTAEGAVPCVRIGRLVRYRLESIEQWIHENE